MVTPKVGAKRVDARKASTRPARMLSVVSISPAGNRERSMPGRRLLGLGSAALYIDRRDPCKIEIPAGGRVEICDMHQAHPYRAVME
jgi:hypothetical protein